MKSISPGYQQHLCRLSYGFLVSILPAQMFQVFDGLSSKLSNQHDDVLLNGQIKVLLYGSPLVPGVHLFLSQYNDLVSHYNDLISRLNDLAFRYNDTANSFNDFVSHLNDFVSRLNDLVSGQQKYNKTTNKILRTRGIHKCRQLSSNKDIYKFSFFHILSLTGTRCQRQLQHPKTGILQKWYLQTKT